MAQYPEAKRRKFDTVNYDQVIAQTIEDYGEVYGIPGKILFEEIQRSNPNISPNEINDALNNAIASGLLVQSPTGYLALSANIISPYLQILQQEHGSMSFSIYYRALLATIGINRIDPETLMDVIELLILSGFLKLDPQTMYITLA